MLRESLFQSTKKSAILLAILAFLFVVALITYAIKTGDTIRFPDESHYLLLAQNLATTGHYTIDGSNPTAFHPPAYPLLLAAGMKLGLPITALRVVNASTLLACMALLYILLRKTSIEQARIAVLLIMAYPVLFYTASTFYPQIPAAALFLSALVLLFSNAPLTPDRSFAAGLLLGCAILMVPTFGFVLLFTATFIAIHPLRYKMLANAAVLICGAGIVIAPWVARNAVVFGRFIPVSTNNGVNLLLGNNENTTPNSGTTVDISRYEKSASTLSEIDANEFYTQSALNFIKTHPSESFKLYAGKVINYFNYENSLYMKTEQSRTRTLIMLLSYGLLLGLAVLRLIMTFRYPLTLLEKYITWLYLLNAPVSAVFFTRIRFRLPMDILLTVIAASAVIIIAGYIRERFANSPLGLGIHSTRDS